MVEENIHSILRYSLVGYYAVLLFILYWSALFGPEFVNQFSNAIITLLSGPGLGFIIFNVYHHRYKGDKQTGEESRTYFKEFESILAALNKNRKKKLTIDRNAQRAIHDVALSENEGVQNRIFFLSSRAHTFGAIHLSTEIVIVFAMLLGSFMFKTLDIHLFYIILAILVSLAVIKVFPSLMDKDLKLIDELECTWMREPKNRDKINDLIKSYLKWNKQPPASSLQRPKSSPRAKNNTVFTKLQYLAIVVLIVNVIFILFWISNGRIPDIAPLIYAIDAIIAFVILIRKIAVILPLLLFLTILFSIYLQTSSLERVTSGPILYNLNYVSDVNNMSIQNFQAKVIYGPATSVTQNFDLFPNNVASDFTANLVFMMPSQTKFYAVNITEVNSFNQSTQNQIFNQSGEFKNKSVDLQFSFQLYKVYHVNTYYELPSMEPSSTIWFNFISREAYKPIIDWMLVVVYFKELAYECYGPCIVPFGNEVTRPHEQGTDLNGIIYSSQIVKGQNTQGFGFTLITVHKMVGLIRQVLFALITGLIILVVDFAVSSRRRSQLSA